MLSLFPSCQPLPVGHDGGWGANHWSFLSLFPLRFYGSRLSLYVCLSCNTRSTSLLICLRGPYVITALLLCVMLFLLFVTVSMMLLFFGFELFILGLYHGGALQAIMLSISLELFDDLDYFVSGLRPVCTYESFSEVLRHLPLQLVVEVVLFHWHQE